MQNPKRFRKQCGAIALPGKKPGCVCIVGIIDTLEIYLLGEFESRDCRELVQKCFYFDETIYGEKRWLADADHIALKDGNGAMVSTRLRRRRFEANTSSPTSTSCQRSRSYATVNAGCFIWTMTAPSCGTWKKSPRMRWQTSNWGPIRPSRPWRSRRSRSSK